MKLIEAMKRIKANKVKIEDLRQKIGAHCANLDFETPVYGANAGAQITEWLQSASDTAEENVRLLVAIARTNLATTVTIRLGDSDVTRPIAYWVWRRREYAAVDQSIWGQLGDRGLKEGNLPTSTGEARPVKLIRHFDPVIRDRKVAEYRDEPHLIDAALEVVNAVTNLIEA